MIDLTKAELEELHAAIGDQIEATQRDLFDAPEHDRGEFEDRIQSLEELQQKLFDHM